MDESGTLTAEGNQASARASSPQASEAGTTEAGAARSTGANAFAAPSTPQAAEPAVSALIITYNHERYIRQALDGVLAQQTTFPFEIIVSEDCSTDGTAEIVESYVARYPGRIRFIRSEVNLRDNEVALRAMRMARGRYITFLDGDDYWVSTDKLQAQVDFMEANPDSAVTYHDVERVTDDGEVVRVMRGLGHRGTIADLIKGNFIGTCSVMLRRTAVAEVPDWINALPAGDWPLYFLAARSGFIDHIEGIVSRYRIHGESYWASRPLAEQILLGICMLVEIESHLGPAYAPLFLENRRATARHVLATVLNEPHAPPPAATDDLSPQIRQSNATEPVTTRIQLFEMKTRINEAEAQRSQAEWRAADVAGRLQVAEAGRDEAWRHATNLANQMAASQATAADLSARLWDALAQLRQMETGRQDALETARRQFEADRQAIEVGELELRAALVASQRRIRRIRRREKCIGIGLGIMIAVLIGWILVVHGP